MPRPLSIQDAEDVPSWQSIKALRKSKLDMLTAKRLDAADRKKAAIADLEDIDNVMQAVLIQASVDLVMVGDNRVRLCTGKNITVSRKDLVLAGVDSAIVEKCTKTKEYTYVKVTPPKAADEEVEDE